MQLADPSAGGTDARPVRTPCLAFPAFPFGVESMLHSQAGLYMQQCQYSQPTWKVLPLWHGGLTAT